MEGPKENRKLMRCYCGEFTLNVIRWYERCLTETVTLTCKDCGEELQIAAEYPDA